MSNLSSIMNTPAYENAHVCDKKNLTYALIASEKGLTIRFLAPTLVHGDDRFQLKEIQTILCEGLLKRNSKDVTMVVGTLDDFLTLLQQVDQGDIKPVQTEADYHILCHALPGMVDFYSFEMLYLMHTTKGHCYHEIIPKAEAKAYFTDLSKRSLTEYEKVAFKLFEVGDDLVLRIIFPYRHHLAGILVSEDYLFTTEPLDLSKVLVKPNGDYRNKKLSEEDTQTLSRFDERYPQFGLRYFANRFDTYYGSTPFLFPLLCGSYHKGMETLAKSGCACVALFHMDYYINMHFAKSGSCQALYGLPAKVLRRFTRSIFEDNDLPTDISQLHKLYATNPVLFQFPEYNCNMIHFLCEIIVQDHYRDSNEEYLYKVETITGPRGLNQVQVLKVLRYLSDLDEWDYSDYLDYISMSLALDGKINFFPKELCEAHGRITDEYNRSRRDHSALSSLNFKRNVASYKYLESDQDDTYLIRCPKDIDELYAEGRSMHHCVASYANRVSAGQSKILFLRRKIVPEEPFVTLEVSPRNVLLQAKARFNTQPDEETQSFIRSWCQSRLITIDTYDMDEIA